MAETTPAKAAAPAKVAPKGEADVWRKPSAINAPFFRTYTDSKSGKQMRLRFDVGVPVRLTAEQVAAVAGDLEGENAPLAFYEPDKIEPVKVVPVVETGA